MPEFPDFTSLNATLVWLAGVGCIVAANWLFGKVLSGVPKWNALPKSIKWIVPPIFAVLVGMGATYVLKQEALLAQIAPYFTMIMTIILGYFGSQVAHLQTKQLAKPSVLIVTQNKPEAPEKVPGVVQQVDDKPMPAGFGPKK